MEKVYKTEGTLEAIIITGYLGSGKTTLINKILEHSHKSGKEIAILENEFGSVGIDGKLIKNKGIEIREVAGGCVCCTQQGRLISELLAIYEMGFKQVVIEASGVADPNSIASELFEPALFGKVRRGNGICVVDGINARHYIEEEVAIRQISFADILYISKNELDPLTMEKVTAISSTDRILNNSSNIDINESQVNGEIEFKPKLISKIATENKDSHGFDAYTFRSAIAFGIEEFRYAINQLLKEEKYYRIKGLVKCSNSDSFILESVRYYGEEKSLAEYNLEDPESTELVFIGKGVDKNHIDSVLMDAMILERY